MRVYVIVEHAHTDRQSVWASSVAMTEFDAIASFLDCHGLPVTGGDWKRLEAQGYTCQPAELTLLREVGK